MTLAASIALDLAHLVDPDSGFGESITLPGPSTVNMIVLDGFDEVEDPRSPVFVCRTSDAAALSHGDTLIRVSSSVSYTLEGYQPGPAGITRLQMAPA